MNPFNFVNRYQNHYYLLIKDYWKSITLNFLDIKIKRTAYLKIETSTFRKPTFTGVMLNWTSLTSIRYKNGLIRCLLNRLNTICSSDQQKVEMAQLRLIYLNYNYPAKIIDKEFEMF